MTKTACRMPRVTDRAAAEQIPIRFGSDDAGGSITRRPLK
jgi:hypothetical protein